MSSVTTPGPTADEDSAPFWAALRGHRLLLQKCGNCGEVRFPRMPGCPQCGSSASEDVSASGHGRIYSWVVVHRPLGRSPKTRCPARSPRSSWTRAAGCSAACSTDRRRDLPVTAGYADHDAWTELAFVPARSAEHVSGGRRRRGLHRVHRGRAAVDPRTRARGLLRPHRRRGSRSTTSSTASRASW